MRFHQGFKLAFLVFLSLFALIIFPVPLLGGSEPTFQIWANSSSTDQINIVGDVNENITLVTTLSIHLEGVTILIDNVCLCLDDVDLENFYMCVEYLETDIEIFGVIPLAHLVINGSHVDEGIPLLGAILGLQTCHTADAHLGPPLTSLIRMNNMYVVARELSCKLEAENVVIRV